MSRGLPTDHTGRALGAPRAALTRGLKFNQTAAVSGTTNCPAGWFKLGFDTAVFPPDGSGRRPIGLMVKAPNDILYSGGNPDNPSFPPVAADGSASLAAGDEYAFIPVDFIKSGADAGFHAGWLSNQDVTALEFVILAV